MHNLFPGYYPDKSIKIDLQSEKTLVVFDANVLLNLYRFPSEASNDLLIIMEAIADRMWLPFQSAHEYHRNRLSVIAEQNKRFRDAKKLIKDTISSFEGKLAQLQLKKRHSTIDPETVLEAMRSARDDFIGQLDAMQKQHLDVIDDDPILTGITELFAERVGSPPKNQEAVDEIEKEGEKRYEEEVPPGYLEQPKKGVFSQYRGLKCALEYGDLVLWKQIIEYCSQKSVEQLIFVTDDDKDDWWLIVDSGGEHRIGPRPELVDELYTETSVTSFFMLSSDRFALRFSELLNIELKQSTVTQVEDVRSTLTNRAADGLVINDATGRIYIDGKQLEPLTSREHQLLLFFYEHNNEVLDRPTIMRSIWEGEDSPNMEVRLEKLISRLRQKIEDDAENPEFLTTVRGRGYTFNRLASVNKSDSPDNERNVEW